MILKSRFTCVLLALMALVDAPTPAATITPTLETDPPYSARVTFHYEQSATGWNAPAAQPWLTALLDHASQTCYGKPAADMGEGGTIPFMGMLGAKFPEAQMLCDPCARTEIQCAWTE